jgi:hypothetical protein
LARSDKISWRNQANGANLDLEVNSSNQLLFGGNSLLTYHQSPSVTMVWKDSAKITVQAGDYYCGNAWLNLATDMDWAWTLDTGSSEASTWYYLYLANVAGTATPVSSKTAPTALINTSLSGTTYDVNIYLGAFYTDSGKYILRFCHCGNRFLWLTEAPGLSHTGDTNFTSKTALIPTTAIIALGWLSGNTALVQVNISDNGTNTTKHVLASAYGTQVWVEQGITTPQTLYLKTNDATKYVYFYQGGWIDKWL